MFVRPPGPQIGTSAPLLNNVWRPILMDEKMRTTLIRLEGDVTALRNELARSRPAGGRPEVRPGTSIRRRLLAPLCLALFLTLVPLGMLAAGSFTDLDPNSPHNGNI